LFLSSERFSGVLAPVITPFQENLAANHSRFADHCRWITDHGCGLAVFGTNSEANSMSVPEKIDLLDHLVATGIEPKLMMPGTGCCALTDSIKLTNHVLSLGCRSVLMLPPFYFKKVSDEGLYAYYSSVIEGVGNSNLRIYLYHIPAFSQTPLSIELIDRLVKNYPETIAGIKDSSGDWGTTKAFNSQGWDDFRVFCGSEVFLLQNLRAGGAGCISATANVNPAAIVNLYQQWQTAEADSLQDNLNRVREIFQNYPMIPALKAATAIFSGDSFWYRVRPPLTEMTKAQLINLTAELSSNGFDMPGL
jgi:4-hydroxy-tetrahydrodipicolinate synthase|tara:strand:+ start:11856 stop:12773 length:918 start_codon:yes stop_codon:yes gene_type:complete